MNAADTQKVAALAIATTTFHWGLHGWAVYAIVGLALAFFAYNKGLPLTIRSAFYPIFGERIWGWPGHIIDTFAIFAGLFGLATSLGFRGAASDSRTQLSLWRATEYLDDGRLDSLHYYDSDDFCVVRH